MWSVTISPKVCQSVKHYSSWAKMKWYKTNFNMPVPDLWWWWWREWSPLDKYWESTNWDLTWFRWWLEICAFFTLFKFWWSLSWTVYLKQEWWHPNNNLIFSNWPVWVNLNLSSWYWYEYELWMNTWCCPWEVNQSWTYTLKSIVTWAISGQVNTSVTFTNVPSNTQDTSKSWSVWCEWWNLEHYVADWWRHTIPWSWWWNVWSDKAGSIWIWNDNFIYWVDQDWTLRKTLWALEQFASTWSNWPTWSVSGQIPWCIYMDNQFWQAHISYIWANWKKYLTWMWNDPTSVP